MSEINNITGYNNKIKNTTFTLKEALDIRKFEIELYWKRTTYYWAFVAVIFAGYFLLNTKGEGNNLGEIKIIVAILGLLFSFGWYLSNRGSKYWQENWEKHVTLLQNDYLGELYNTVLSWKNMKRRYIFKSYPYSVSRINQILSFIISFVWVIILVYSITNFLGYSCLQNEFFAHNYKCFFVIFSIFFLIIFLLILFLKGESNLKDVNLISNDLKPESKNSTEDKMTLPPK